MEAFYENISPQFKMGSVVRTVPSKLRNAASSYAFILLPREF